MFMQNIFIVNKTRLESVSMQLLEALDYVMKACDPKTVTRRYSANNVLLYYSRDFIKKTLQQGCFLVNFTKFLRATFLQKH